MKKYLFIVLLVGFGFGQVFSKEKLEFDVKAELKKYKEMLDEGLIDKEDYEAKKDKLLGI